MTGTVIQKEKSYMTQDIMNTEEKKIREIKEDASSWTIVQEDGTIIIETKEDKLELGVNTKYLTDDQQDKLVKLIRLIKKYNPYLRPDQFPLVDAFARSYMIMASSTAILQRDISERGEIDPRKFAAYNTVMNKLEQFAGTLMISPKEVNSVMGGISLPKEFDGDSVLMVLHKKVNNEHDKKMENVVDVD